METFLLVWLIPLLITFLIFLCETFYVAWANQALGKELSPEEFKKEILKSINYLPFLVVSIPIIGGIWLILMVIVIYGFGDVDRDKKFGKMITKIEKLLFKFNFKVQSLFKK